MNTTTTGLWTYEQFPYQCRRLARIAFDQYTRDTTHLYLVGIKRHGRWVTAFVAHGHSEGESYIITDPLPRNLDLEALTDWLMQRLRHEPVLTD